MKIFTLLFLIFAQKIHSDMHCQKLFAKDNVLFAMLTPMKDVYSKNMEIDEMEGTVITHPCQDVQVPKECVAENTARLVFKPKNSNKCIVINKDGDWDWKFSKNVVQEKTFTAQKEGEHSVQFVFECEKNDYPIINDISFRYTESKKTFIVTILSKDGCGVDFPLFQIINENPIVSGIIFLFFGLTFCLLGYKIYKDLLMCFIVGLIIVLGFYLYVSYIEKNLEQNSKFYLIVGLLFGIMVLASLIVMFTNIIFWVLAFLASYTLGLMLHDEVSKHVEFFQREHTQYIIIAVLFIVFVVVFLKIKNYLIVFSTALQGAFLILVSLFYLGVTKYDLLFDFEMQNIIDLQDQDKMNFVVLYLLISLIGAFVQIKFFLHKSKKKEDLNIELNFKH